MTRSTHQALADERNASIEIYINGEFFPRDEAKISVFDSGFLVGDGIWEGIRLHHGVFAHLDRHLDSLFVAASQTTGRDQADITGLIGQYAHGNEPSHHMAYLYPLLGRAPTGQKYIRQIMDELYSDRPDGLSGNEDCGQMSAWYVFSALGFYPIAPGAPCYVLGTPLFPDMTLSLGQDSLRIRREGGSAENFYVAKVRLNGNRLDRPWIWHSELLGGGELVFEMAEKPTNPWPEKAFPIPSLPSPPPAVPVIQAASQTFGDQLPVEIKALAGTTLEITWDESERVSTVNLDTSTVPALLDDRSTLTAVAIAPDGRRSYPVTGEFYRVDDRKTIDLRSTYANQYAAGGDKALIDYLRGGANFRTGRWQGYREDLEAVVDLGQTKEVTRVAVGFLQDTRSWIFMPKEVEIAVSTDGSTFTPVGSGGLGLPDDDETVVTKDFEAFPKRLVRYVRVRAQQYGVCPPGHLGAGGKTWIFADEIVVE